MEKRHSGSPRPKRFRVQKSAGKVLASIFWNQDGILLIDYLPKGQTINAEYYSSLLMQLKGFWRKTAAGSSRRVSCSCTTMSRLTGHLLPRRNWPTWTSSVLITHPILRIWPPRNTICSLDWKNNWKIAIFRPTRRSLLPRRPGWTDNLLIFLSGLQKVGQWAKKWFEFRGEYVEKIPCLVAVACSIPGRAKDLSAPPRIQNYYFACCFAWVWNLDTHIERGREAEDVEEKGAEENIWA